MEVNLRMFIFIFRRKITLGLQSLYTYTINGVINLKSRITLSIKSLHAPSIYGYL